MRTHDANRQTNKRATRYLKLYVLSPVAHFFVYCPRVLAFHIELQIFEVIVFCLTPTWTAVGGTKRVFRVVAGVAGSLWPR